MPERLKGDLSGHFSRRENQRDRYVYSIDEKRMAVCVLQCKGHYGDRWRHAPDDTEIGTLIHRRAPFPKHGKGGFFASGDGFSPAFPIPPLRAR